MSDRRNRKERNRLTIGIAVMLSLSIMALALVTPATAQETIAGSRTITPTTVAPGDTFTVTVAIDITGTVYGPVLDEDVPAGWTVTEADNAGGTPGLGTSWLWSGAQTTDKTVVYDVTVPDDAAGGDYPVTGTVLATAAGETIGPFTITGDESVTVSTGPSPTPTQPTTIVEISPSTQTADLEETFTVNITVDPDTAIGGAQADLSFDSSLVRVNSVSTGGMFPSFMVIGPIDNAGGTVTGIIGYFTGGTTTTTPGTLATINLTANSTNTGTATLGLFNVKVVDRSGSKMPSSEINGTATVGSTPSSTLAPGGGNGGATTTPTPTHTPGETPTPPAEVTPTPTPFVEETPSPSLTLTPTPAPTVSPTPTPKEPGFEAVFAIAGLLAVAYLVLRRKRK